MGLDKAIYEKLVESGSSADNTYAQNYKVYLESNAVLDGLWNYGTAYKEVRGTSAVPVVMAAAGNFEQGYYSGSGATGTYRGVYKRLYLTGGAGGEAGRFYTTVSNNAPADTVNGVHCSLNFGASAGNITGLGTAGRFTLHVPNRSLGGTFAAVQAELWADGASSVVGGTGAALRVVADGDATGKAAIEDVANLLHIDVGTNASGNMVGSLAGNEPTWASHTGLIRCNFNGVTAYLVAITV